MKLIVDAQLPVKLCEVLNQLVIESIHVDELPRGDEIAIRRAIPSGTGVERCISRRQSTITSEMLLVIPASADRSHRRTGGR